MLKLICIPAYNESATIEKVVNESKEFGDLIVVCDDGSLDDTSFKAKKAGAYVIKHKKNLGKGAALKSLFEYAKKAKAEIVVTIDGDGQFLPKEIPKLISPILENKADIVIGYRFENKEEIPTYRKIGNRMLDKVANITSTLPFSDSQSGFRSYSKTAINSLNFNAKGFGADSEILIDASKKGLRIVEEKISVIYNTGQKTSTKNPMSHFVEVLTSLLEIIALRRPLSLLGIPGIILIIIGAVFASIVLSMFNETRYFSLPYTLLSFGSIITGLMFLLMSVVLFGMGRFLRKESFKN